MGNFYVDEKNQTKIVCKKCGLSKIIDVNKFRDTHKKMKAKCKCGEAFRLTLDFRRHYRKNVQLPGECFIQKKGERDDILIIDVSMSGINFTTFKPHNFSIDDTVELSFAFDNPMRTKVRELVKIKRIAGRNIGAEYINQSRMKRIWFLV
jgi:hypothetical protein